MFGTDTITVGGTVVEVISERLLKVSLPNGHRLIARTSSRVSTAPIGVVDGDRVIVALSPCDFSRGLVVSKDS